ncbi:hippocampus abundant transcript 1 protein [Silurus meridionalis]|nr:hippocampus abundant transcript 1 protein [Silurus meridionalis]
MTGEKKKKKRLNRSILLAKKIIIKDGGSVSATFAASLVTSPAIGAYLSQVYGDTLVVILASAIALLDIAFILSLRKVGQDSTVLLICITVFLSYLPEAGQYSSFFLYLRQTVVLGVLMRSIGNKNTILLGLGFQILQLAWYGFGSQPWGLCNGLGPALYGFVFYLFHSAIIPGPPFLFGACSVLLSLLVALFIPEHNALSLRSGNYKKHASTAQSHTHTPQGGVCEGKEPLLDDSSV